MSKRHVEELSRVAERLLRDAAATFPALTLEFERDLIRLRKLVKGRGVYVYVVDMPRVGKHLDRCLSTGEYSRSGLPASQSISGRIPIPKLLRGLYLLVFDKDGRLKEDCNHQAVFFLRQILYLGKKCELECSPEAKYHEVLEFLATDEVLPEPNQFWSDDRVSRDVPNTSFVEAFGSPEDDEVMSAFLGNLDELSRLLTSTLGPYDPGEWRFRHGPGATSASNRFTRNKYSWCNWSDRLDDVFPIADYGYHNYSAWAHDTENREVGSEEPASRLLCVPKTYTRPRIICAEPSEHQWCQQNIWHFFCSGVRRSWINGFCRFRDQTLNQELCQVGSRTGDLCTLDLSSASDLVSCEAVGCLFRSQPTLVRALAATRTRLVSLPFGLGTRRLRKFATMGSACTFPVESLLFLSICLAACLTKRKLKVNRRNVGTLLGEVAVFGDDLVIPKDSRDLVISGLERLHFRVNHEKSFTEGNFRESCGVDYFQGQVVTPAYWKGLVTRSAESVAMSVTMHNNFFMKGLYITARHMASTVRKRCYISYVHADSDIMGLKTYDRSKYIVTGKPRVRWNKDLHRLEVRVRMVVANQTRTPVHDDTALLQYFTERPSPLTEWSSGVAQCPVVRINNRWVDVHRVVAQLA